MRCRPWLERGDQAESACVSLYGGCAWETFGSAGGDSSWSANPRTVATQSVSQQQGGHSFFPNRIEPYDPSKFAPPLHPHVPNRNRLPGPAQRVARLRQRAPQCRARLTAPDGLFQCVRLCRARHQYRRQYRPDHGPGCGGCVYGDGTTRV